MEEVVDPARVAALDRMIGVALDADEVNRRLSRFARSIGAPVIGAHQISCSDESERECVESFHEIFVRQLLPELKYWNRSSFRTANLGGRYEQGSVALVEDHFATARSAGKLKLLVTKVNSHVSVDESVEPALFGRLDRYERESIYCGALHAVLEGSPRLPAFREIAELLEEGPLDRVALLRDAERIDPTHRALFAAIAHAQLQGARVVEEACELTPRTPTVFLVIAAVTLNRVAKDMELVCARWIVDRRGARARVGQRGIGTDPRRYRIGSSTRRLEIETTD